MNKKYIGFGIRPSDKDFFKITKTQYEPNPEQKIGNYDLVLNTPTVKAYLDSPSKTIMLSIRGTTDGRDVTADTMIPFNRLKYSNRYIEDKNIISNLVTQYPPEDYDYYATAHSLGVALMRQLQREFPFIKNTVGFNGAVQPYDIVDQKTNLNKSYYTEEDALYKLGGRLLNNKIVIPSTVHTLKIPSMIPLPSSVKIGKFGYNASQGHKLDNFEGVLGGSCCMCHAKHIVRGGAVEKREFNSFNDFKTTELRKIASIFNKFFKIKLSKLNRDEILNELEKYLILAENGSIYVNEENFLSIKPKAMIKEIEASKIINKLKKEEKPKTRRQILQKEKVGDLKALLNSLGFNPKGLRKEDIIGRILMIETKNRKDNAKEFEFEQPKEKPEIDEAESLFRQMMEDSKKTAKKRPKIEEEEELSQFERDEFNKKIEYIHDLIVGPDGIQKIEDNLEYIKKNSNKNTSGLQKIINNTRDFINQIDFDKVYRTVDYEKFVNWYKKKYPKDYKNLPKNYDNQKYDWLDFKITEDGKKIIKNLLKKNNIKLPDTEKLEKELNKLDNKKKKMKI